jgi:hypothetical protein
MENLRENSDGRREKLRQLADRLGVPPHPLEEFHTLEEEESDRTPEEIDRYWVDWVHDRTKVDQDTLICFTGPRGSSKSAGAQTLARKLDPGFRENWRERTTLLAADTLRQINKASKVPGSVVVYDEAATGALAQDRWSDEVRAIYSAMTLSRALRVTLILCIPDIWSMAGGIRDYVDLMVLCDPEKRGEGKMHVSRHVFRFKKGAPLLHKYEVKQWSPWKWPNPEGKEWWREYKEWSLEAKREIVRSLETQARKSKTSPGRLVRCPKCKGTFTTRSDAERVNCHHCQTKVRITDAEN